MTTLILVRHGQSVGNLHKKFLGHCDWDLSEQGYLQANITKEYLKDRKIDAVYSSDLMRAYNTVAPIAKQRNLEIVKDKQLREIYAGEWEGKKYDELLEQFPDDYGTWLNDIGNARCTGGESVRELQQRIICELVKISEANLGKTVCIGTHATPIRALTAYISGVDFDEMKNIPWVKNASVTIVTYDEGHFQMIEYGIEDFLGSNVTALGANV